MHEAKKEPIMSSVGVVVSVYHKVRAAIATSHAAAAAAYNAHRPTLLTHRRADAHNRQL